MPIYEYECRACGRAASFLVRNTEAHRRPACPHCRARGMHRVLSRFSAVGRRGRKADGDAPPDGADTGREDALDAGLAQAMDGMDANDPRAMGRMMRRMSEATGEPLDAETDEVVRRLEAGEDPDAIDDDLVSGPGGADDGDPLYDG